MKKTVLSIIFASLITATSVMMFSGCGNKETSTPDEATTTVATSAEITTSPTTSTVPTTVPKTTVPKEVKDLVDKGEIKVDKDGNITDKNGKKVEVKDGKVEVKTDDGKTVTVKVDDVKTTVSNNSNKGNTEKKEDTKSNTSDNDKKPAKPSNSSSNNQKPAKPSNSSSNNQKPAKPSESSKTETTAAKKYKYYKHHDAVTKFHDKEWIVTGTHEEPVYGWVGYNVCNDCGMKMKDAKEEKQHLLWEARENGGTGSYHYEKEYVQTGTKTVEDGHWREAYTETITPAYDEEVSENDHWDKKVPIN